MAKKNFFWLTLSMGLLFPSLSISQNKDTDNHKNKVLDEVTVTTNRVDKINLSKLPVSMQELPITATQLNLNLIKKRGIYTLKNATRFIPAVNTRLTYGAFNRISIRGFDNSPVDIDGMRDERTTFNSYPLPDLSSVETIEVVKGPASILTGHSSVGGVVNIVRKKAKKERELNVNLIGGTLGTYQGNFDITGNIVGGLSSLLNVNYSAGKGWRSTNDRKFSIYNNTRYDINENHTLDFTLSYNNDYYGTEIGLPPTMPNDIYDTNDKLVYKKGDMLKGLSRTARYNNESDFMYNKGFNTSLKYDWNIAKGWSLTEYVMYTNDRIDYFGTEELSYRTSDNPIYKNYIKNADGSKKYIDIDNVQLTFPLRFQHYAQTIQNQLFLNGEYNICGVNNKFVLGTSYTFMDRVSFMGYNDADTNTAVEADGFDVYGPGVQSIVSVKNPKSQGKMYSRFSKARPTDTQVVSAYLQNFTEFNEYFKTFIGLRFDNYNLKGYVKQDVNNRSNEYDKSKKVIASDLSYNPLTYRFGFVFTPIKHLTYYGSFASCFLPIRNSYSDNNIYIDRNGKEIKPSNFDKAIFEPMRGYQVELGNQFSLSDKLSTTLSVFYIVQNDVVKTLGTVNRDIAGVSKQVKVIGQVGRVDSKGFEMEVKYNPVQNLNLTAGYSFQDVRIAEMKKNDLGFQDAEKDKPLNNIPAHKFYTYGDYFFSSGLLEGLSLDYTVSYTGKIYRSYSSDLYFEPYTLVGAGVHYTIKNSGVTLGLECNNLLDKKYISRSLGSQLVPEAPRSFLFMFSYKL